MTVSYPCDYIDKGGLAVTDGARGCSGTPIWQLHVSGALDPAHVRTALADVVARYPSLRTRVEAVASPGGEPLRARRFRYVEAPDFSVDAIYRVVDARDQATLDAIVQEERNRHTDLFRDPPMTLTLVRTADDGGRLIFRQHHAIADGRAFIGLLADFAAYLDAARRGTRPIALVPAGPIDRRDELAPLSLSRWRHFAWRLAGYFVLARLVARALLRPPVPLLQNRSNDYTGANDCVHLVVADPLDAWNAARKRLGVSLNSMLTAALFAAVQRWHRDAAAPLGRTTSTLIMETRPRSGGFFSFANHLATLDVEIDLGRVDDPAAMARSIQAQVDAQKRTNRPFKRLLAERAVVAGMRLDAMQRMVFQSKQPSYNLNFSNLIALDFPTLAGEGWRVDDVRITTPVTPRTGIALTAIRYDGRVIFNFNYKSSVVSRAEVDTLASHFSSIVTAISASGSV
jgi:condensation domain-containing protein/uncharacterized protein DUF1298